jgi:putative tricarboxylic transport membrane protein
VKFSDTISGSASLLLGLSVIAYARTFPPMPGQDIGPGRFPILIGIGLALLGIGLIASGRRSGGPAVQLDDWMRRPRMALNFGLVVAGLVFYAAAVDRLGFLITASIFLAGLMLAFGVKRTVIVPLAIGVTLAIHLCFYTLLRVPLPWGLLEGIAW